MKIIYIYIHTGNKYLQKCVQAVSMRYTHQYQASCKCSVCLCWSVGRYLEADQFNFVGKVYKYCCGKTEVTDSLVIPLFFSVSSNDTCNLKANFSLSYLKQEPTNLYGHASHPRKILVQMKFIAKICMYKYHYILYMSMCKQTCTYIH